MNSVRANRRALRSVAAMGALLLVPSLLLAHPGHEPAGGFAYGFLHPFSGLDHICAMIAVGIWAAGYEGRTRWAAPSAFVGMMAVGGSLGVAGVTGSFVEGGIVASLLVLGILIAAAARLSPRIAVPLVGIFALFHGFAHGAEMPVSASGLPYGAGFILSTIVFHLAGIALALFAQRLEKRLLVRYTGAAIAIVGLVMWASR